MPDPLTQLQDELRAFATARDWEQFHSPKNLAIGVSIESAELLEHFLWLDDNESFISDIATREKITLEMADVLIYLLRLADQLEIDLVDATRRKMAINEDRYPAEKVRGSHKKYSEYE